MPSESLALPARVVEAMASAWLPKNYEAAKLALAECERIDEAADVADKMAALATYARQADDPELENHARRIRARAVRRCGEILREYDARGGDRSKNATPNVFAFSRAEAAKDAGLTPAQALTATRVASLRSEDFEHAIEAAKPPGTTMLAKIAQNEKREREAGCAHFTSEDLAEVLLRNQCREIFEALLRIEQNGRNLTPELIADFVRHPQRGNAVGRVNSVLDFLAKVT